MNTKLRILKGELKWARRSWIGRFLLRTTAFAIILTAYLGAVSVLPDAVHSVFFPGSPTQRVNSLVVWIPTGLAVLAWIQDAVTTMVHRRRRQRRYVPPEHGYFRVDPYSALDGGPSYSRLDGAHDKVLRWISDAPSSFLYLTGRSGCGKSSLVSAWIKPKLEQKDWIVLVFRGFNDPLQAIASAISAPGLLWKRPPSGTDPRSQLRMAAARAAENNRRVLIVIDQFEEFLIVHDEQAVIRLKNDLATLYQTCSPTLRLLLAFRSEYEYLVDHLGLPPLHQSENWKEICAYVKNDAMQFMKCGLPDVNDILLDRLMSGLEDVEGTPGLFRPITLNMAGLVLYRDAGALGQAPERLMHRYISDAIEIPEIADFSRQILAQMVTDGGSKRPHVSLARLAAQTQLKIFTVRQCLNRLSATSLVIPLDNDRRHWEISHDFLAQLIAKIIGGSRTSPWPTVWRWIGPTLLSIALFAVLFAAALHPAILTSKVDYAKARLSDLGCFSEFELSFSLADTPDCRTKRLPDMVQLADIVSYIVTVLNGPRLVSLDLSSFAFGDITPLRHFSELEELSIRISRNSHLGPISAIEPLRILNLRDSEVSDLKPLSNLANLRRLDLANTDVKELYGIATLIELDSLDLRRTKVTDLTPLSGLHLSSLSLQHTEVVDLSPLSDLAHLRSLDLSHTRVVDLEPVLGLERLETLLIYCTDVNPEDLAKSPSLTRVFLDADADISSLQLSEVSVHRVSFCGS